MLPGVDEQDVRIPFNIVLKSETGEVTNIETEEIVAHRNSLY